jgi:mannose-6-phosphate isomerase-like protein (cupin superfamily)
MWYFLTGGTVQIGLQKLKVKKGELVKIGAWTAHRIIAANKQVLVLEVSLGKFSERDEVRVEDKYGR